MKGDSPAGLALCLLALLACARSPGWSYKRLVRDPAQGDLVSVVCSDAHANCHAGAAAACPRGFTVEDPGPHTKTRTAYEGALLVRCRPE